jgi:hypothetical protein
MKHAGKLLIVLGALFFGSTQMLEAQCEACELTWGPPEYHCVWTWAGGYENCVASGTTCVLWTECSGPFSLRTDQTIVSPDGTPIRVFSYASQTKPCDRIAWTHHPDVTTLGVWKRATREIKL